MKVPHFGWLWTWPASTSVTKRQKTRKVNKTEPGNSETDSSLDLNETRHASTAASTENGSQPKRVKASLSDARLLDSINVDPVTNSISSAEPAASQNGKPQTTEPQPPEEPTQELPWASCREFIAARRAEGSRDASLPAYKEMMDWYRSTRIRTRKRKRCDSDSSSSSSSSWSSMSASDTETHQPQSQKPSTSTASSNSNSDRLSRSSTLAKSRVQACRTIGRSLKGDKTLTKQYLTTQERELRPARKKSEEFLGPKGMVGKGMAPHQKFAARSRISKTPIVDYLFSPSIQFDFSMRKEIIARVRTKVSDLEKVAGTWHSEFIIRKRKDDGDYREIRQDYRSASNGGLTARLASTFGMKPFDPQKVRESMEALLVPLAIANRKYFTILGSCTFWREWELGRRSIIVEEADRD